MMNPYPQPLDEEIIARAMKLSVSLLLDGAKAAGIVLPCGGCMAPAIMPVNRRLKAAGTAVTVQTQPGDNRPIHLAIYGAGTPGYMLVIDGDAHEGCAYMGDLMLSACKALGFNGVVIDGYIRDWDGVMQLDYPVYSRGLMPRAPTKEKDGKINEPIICAGAHVQPGDLVMGDCDGVCVIPREHVGAVLDAAEKRQAYEAAREAEIKAYTRAKEKGEEPENLTPAWAREALKQGRIWKTGEQDPPPQPPLRDFT